MAGVKKKKKKWRSKLYLGSELVWPSGGVRLVSRGTSVEYASALLSLQRLWSVDTVL